MNISKEAIKAAAQAIWEVSDPFDLEECATAAVAAVTPIIAAQAKALREALEAMVEDMSESIGFDSLVHGREAEYPVSHLRGKLEELLATHPEVTP